MQLFAYGLRVFLATMCVFFLESFKSPNSLFNGYALLSPPPPPPLPLPLWENEGQKEGRI